jgi:hypothetical protein
MPLNPHQGLFRLLRERIEANDHKAVTEKSPGSL